MFFRNKKIKIPTFEDRMDTLRGLGFKVDRDGGKATVSKLGCAAVIEDVRGSAPNAGKAGVVIGKEIGLLVNGGFQMFLMTPGGRRVPALAAHLKALHDFQEDLKEGLGLTSLYNESLGTTSDRHLYDRVRDRDAGVPKRVWE